MTSSTLSSSSSSSNPAFSSSLLSSSSSPGAFPLVDLKDVVQAKTKNSMGNPRSSVQSEPVGKSRSNNNDNAKDSSRRSQTPDRSNVKQHNEVYSSTPKTKTKGTRDRSETRKKGKENTGEALDSVLESEIAESSKKSGKKKYSRSQSSDRITNRQSSRTDPRTEDSQNQRRASSVNLSNTQQSVHNDNDPTPQKSKAKAYKRTMSEDIQNIKSRPKTHSRTPSLDIPDVYSKSTLQSVDENESKLNSLGSRDRNSSSMFNSPFQDSNSKVRTHTRTASADFNHDFSNRTKSHRRTVSSDMNADLDSRARIHNRTSSIDLQDTRGKSPGRLKKSLSLGVDSGGLSSYRSSDGIGSAHSRTLPGKARRSLAPRDGDDLDNVIFEENSPDALNENYDPNSFGNNNNFNDRRIRKTSPARSDIVTSSSHKGSSLPRGMSPRYLKDYNENRTVPLSDKENPRKLSLSKNSIPDHHRVQQETHNGVQANRASRNFQVN